MNASVIRIVDANANASVCTPCGGQCCQRMPGTVFPADLDPNLRFMTIAGKAKAMLESGRYAIDWWEGSPIEGDTSLEPGYYLRPATKGNEGLWSDPGWGGACTFHTDTGCSLSEEERPTECKALKPVSPGKCEMPEDWEGRRTGAKAWWPYRNILRMLRDMH